ncbi:unnamed protein product, partial [Effrenium voratum]
GFICHEHHYPASHLGCVMFSDWLELQLDYAGGLWKDEQEETLRKADHSSGSDSDASGAEGAEEAPKVAPTRSEKEPEQELRRRSLLSWRRPEQAVSTEVDERAGCYISGRLLRVKGWALRKGARLEQRSAEVKDGEDGEVEFVWAEDGSSRSVKLRGSAVERFKLEAGEELFGLRVLPLQGEVLDLATATSVERELWVEALGRAAAQRPFVGSDASDAAGRLRVTLAEGALESRRAPAGLFCVVSCQDMSSRTVVKKPTKVPGAGHMVAFGEAFDFPILDDDPDALIRLELFTDGRRSGAGVAGGTCAGRVEVPLGCVGRNRCRELRLPLRDLARPRENSEVGFLKAWCRFDQSYGALLLPRPPRPAKPVLDVGGKGIREQFKELEAFMQEFEVFSSRFIYHCEVSRRSFSAKPAEPD